MCFWGGGFEKREKKAMLQGSGSGDPVARMVPGEAFGLLPLWYGSF